jgi:hypothetical protein
MNMSVESNSDVIIYAPEKIISYARNNQHIFPAQSVWWIASVIGLQNRLITHIDNLQSRAAVALAPRDIPVTVVGSPAEESLSRQDKILEQCEEYLRDSRKLHDLE